MVRKGFTLIEVVVGIALIAILITVIGSVNLMSLKVTGYAGKRDETFSIARGLIEMFKAQELSNARFDKEAVYKYLNSIEDVEELEEIFKNPDGIYFGQEVYSPHRQEKYIAILKAVRISPPIYQAGSMPELDMLKVDVMCNGMDKNTVSLTQVR